MLENYLMIMSLLKEAKEIWTRKKIQKMVYLLQETGAPFGQDFRLHRYGPYSSELQIELDQLHEAALIDQEFKGDSYYFRLTGKGETFMQKEASGVTWFSQLKDIVNKLNNIESHMLEMMSTIVYFEKSYGKNKNNLKSVLASIKPHLMPNFDMAWGLLDKLELHAKVESLIRICTGKFISFPKTERRPSGRFLFH